jgi:uncharacterized protein (DUF58 family)
MYLGLGGAYLLSTLVGGLLVTAWLFDLVTLLVGTNWWRRALTIRRWVAPNPTSVGDSVTLRHQIAAPRPPSVDVSDAVPPELVAVRTVNATTRVLVASRRGLYEFGPVRATRLGPLGLTRFALVADATTRLMVWPTVAPLGPSLGRGVGLNESGRSGPPLQNPEDATIRDYHQGDEWRRIHWRSTARRERLMTRAEEPAQVPLAVVQPAVAPGAADSDIELAIALAASAVVALDGAGFRVRLVTRDGGRSGAPAEHLDHLAQLAVTPPDDLDLVFDPGPTGGRPTEHHGDSRAGLDPDPDARTAVALSLVIVAINAEADSAADPLPGLPQRTSPALAVLVGGPRVAQGSTGGAAAVRSGFARQLDQAGWATVAIEAAAELDAAALTMGAGLDLLSRGRT